MGLNILKLTHQILFTFFNVTARKFKITHVAHIVLLLDSSVREQCCLTELSQVKEVF